MIDDESESSHSKSQYTPSEKTNRRTGDITDVVPMSDVNYDTVTEIKPELAATLVVPKASGGELKETIEEMFSRREWVRYVEVAEKHDITVDGDQLLISGVFYITAHFPSDHLQPSSDEILPTIEQLVEEISWVTDITDIELRMPPYQIGEY